MRGYRFKHLVIFVACDPQATIVVPQVADRLVKEFPGSYITAENSFEAERQRVRTARQRRETGGESTRGIDLVLESIDRKEQATGPGIDLAVALSPSHVLHGYVRARSIRFLGSPDLPKNEVDRFSRFLESLEVGPVQVLELDPPDAR